MTKVLITYAVPQEFVEITLNQVECYYLRTGIGKVKAAFHVAQAIGNVKPDLVLNIGSAGSLKHKIGDILVCRTFIDRDMEKMKNLNIEYRIDSSDLLLSKGLCDRWPGNYTCNTGDSFLTDPTELEGDVIDMEAYAQAFVCRNLGLPFIAVKYVTDIIGQNSVKHWADKLAEAQRGLKLFINDLPF